MTTASGCVDRRSAVRLVPTSLSVTSVSKLLNRHSFLSMAAAAHFRRSIGESKELRSFVWSLDFGGLRTTNKELAHGAGNTLIRGAARFARVLTSDDVAAHLAGDEFAVFVNARSLEECRRLIEQVRAAMFRGVVNEIRLVSRSAPELFHLEDSESEDSILLLARKCFRGVSVGVVEVEPLGSYGNYTLADAHGEIISALHASHLQMLNEKAVHDLDETERLLAERSRPYQSMPGFCHDDLWLRDHISDLEAEFELRGLVHERNALLWKVGRNVVAERPPWLLSVVPPEAFDTNELADALAVDAGMVEMLRARIGYRDEKAAAPSYVVPEHIARLDELVRAVAAVQNFYASEHTLPLHRSALVEPLPPYGQDETEDESRPTRPFN